MGFDIKTALGAFILWLGIVSTPSEVLAGIVISLIVYAVSVLVLGKTLGWRLIIGFCLTVGLSVGLALTYTGLPYLSEMPVQGAMSFSGVLSALIYPKRKPGAQISWLEQAVKNKVTKILK